MKARAIALLDKRLHRGKPGHELALGTIGHPARNIPLHGAWSVRPKLITRFLVILCEQERKILLAAARLGEGSQRRVALSVTSLVLLMALLSPR